MTRSEFSRQWWTHCLNHNEWSVLTTIRPMPECESIWWYNQSVLTSWRLSSTGFRHLCSIPNLGVHKKAWSLMLLHTPALLMKLQKIQCPWYLSSHRNFDGKNYMTNLVLFGEQENMWMTLCDGDLERFLKTWTVDNKQ